MIAGAYVNVSSSSSTKSCAYSLAEGAANCQRTAGDSRLDCQIDSHIFSRHGVGFVSTVAGGGSSAVGGSDGAGTSRYLQYPIGVAVDSVGGVYFTDNNNAFTLRYLNISGNKLHL